MLPVNSDMPDSQDNCGGSQNGIPSVDAEQKESAYGQCGSSQRDSAKATVKIGHTFPASEILYPVTFIQKHPRKGNQKPYTPP